MKERFCKDCPCREAVTKTCHRAGPQAVYDNSNAEVVFVFSPVLDEDWCYMGRKLMEEEERRKTRDSYVEMVLNATATPE